MCNCQFNMIITDVLHPALALQDDAVWEDWLESVMKLLLGFPIHVQLPLDADGRPDFMDAW